MNDQVKARLDALRARMKQEGIDACYIPTADFHGSEYIADYFQTRRYFGGFDGSAGTLVVEADCAYLWTDGRYFLQAEEQLKGTGIGLMRMYDPGVPDIPEYLAGVLKEGDVLALDGRMVGEGEYRQLENALDGVLLRTAFDPAEGIWNDRPLLPKEPVWLLKPEFAGKSAAEKLKEIRAEMAKKCATAHILTTLDDLAWLFNLRGSDIAFNPVFLAYAAIERKTEKGGADRAHLFIDETRVTEEALQSLAAITDEDGAPQVELHPYASVYDFLKKYTLEDSVLLSENQASHLFFDLLGGRTNLLTCRTNPATLLKQKRNDVERVNVCVAHHRDGVAVTKLLYLLKKQYPFSGQAVSDEQRTLRTEMDVVRKLHSLRMEQENCKGDSFETIAGYGYHGAIIHYEPTDETSIALEPKSFLLIDSGGQYPEGTTDITRTVALGPLTEEEKTDFTLVLKGHVDLAMAKFPAGTYGYGLDILARQPLWNADMDYNHGTGHGVGSMLCVHEGPVGFHRYANSRTEEVILEPGMVISNEPGVYKPGKYGIRTESMVLVQPAKPQSEAAKVAGEKQFYKLDTLTCVPIDRDAIRTELLTDAEKGWINGYHAWVLKQLTAHLTAEEAAWLKEACAPLQ